MLVGWRQSLSRWARAPRALLARRPYFALAASLVLGIPALATAEDHDEAARLFAQQIIAAQDCALAGERAARFAEKAAHRIGDAIRAERRAAWLVRTAEALRSRGGREYLAARRGADLARSERDGIVREARATVKRAVAELDTLLDLPQVLRAAVRTADGQPVPFSQQLADRAAQLRSAATPVREALFEVQAVHVRAELLRSQLNDEQGRRMEDSFVRRRANLVEVLAPLTVASEALAQTSREAARWLEETAAKRPLAPAEVRGGLGAGVGIGFLVDVGGRDRVDSARLVPGAGPAPSIVRVEGDDPSTPHIVLEAHYLFPASSLRCLSGNCNTVSRAQPSCRWCGPALMRRLLVGPFIAIQPGDDFVDAVGAGALFGVGVDTFRRGDRVHLGVGYFADPNTRVLADGFQENQPPPNGETQVRFKSVTKSGVMVLLTYGF